MTAQRSLPFERCNIGPAEIARRRRSALTTSAAAIVVIVAVLALHAPVWARLAIFPFAAAVGVSWLQVIRKFCVAFGALGLENFGALGGQHRVDQAIRRADARKALELIVQGVLFGLVITFAILQLPS